MGIVKAQPADPIRQKHKIGKIAEYLRDSYINGTGLRRLWLIGCNTGLRAGDVRNLTIGHFSTENGEKKSYMDIKEQKTGKMRRVYINQAVWEMYLEHVNELREQGVILLSEQSPLFWGYQGYVIGVKYIHFVIRDACRQLGYNGNYGSHTMRKTFAYHAYKKCRSIKLVSQLLNHGDIYTTRLYLQDFENDVTGENKDMTEEDVINMLNLL